MRAILRVIVLAVCALVGAAGVMVAMIAIGDWRTAAQNRKEDRKRIGSSVVVNRPVLPALPPLAPAIAPEEVARIRAAGRPQQPKGKKEDYTWQQIEATLEQLRQERPQRPQAIDDLESWYNCLSDPFFTNSDNFPKHIEALKQWEQELPESSTPQVVLGHAQIHYAWQARGSGYAFTVTEEGWKLFHERIAEARRLLEQAIDRGVKDGQAHALLVIVAKAEGWPREKTDAIVDAARKLDPSYCGTYRAMAEYLLPRWHGEPGDIEKFAANIARAIPGDDGLDAYGQIAYVLNQYEPDRLFYGGFDRTLLAKSAEVLVRRYPYKLYLVPFAALCTIAAQDHAAARRVQPFIQPNNEDVRVPGWSHAAREFEQWCNAREVPTGEADWIWATHTSYGNIAFDTDPRYIWTGRGASATPVVLLDLERKQPHLALIGPGGSLNDLAFDAAKNWLAGIVINSEFKGWVLWNTKQPNEPEVHPTEELPQSIAISPTSNQLALATGKSVQTFDVVTGVEGPRMAGDYAHFLKYSGDGKLLAANCTIWDARTGEKKYDLHDVTKSARRKITIQKLVGFDREHRALATGIEVKPGKPANPLFRFAADGMSWETVIPDLGSHGHATALSADSRLLAVAEQAQGRGDAAGIKVWDLATGRQVKRFGGHWYHIGALAFSPDGKQLASIAMLGGPIKIWSLEDKSE